MTISNHRKLIIATEPAAVKHKAPEIERKITSSESAPTKTRIQARRTTFLNENPGFCSGGFGAVTGILILLRKALFFARGHHGDPE